MGNPDSAHDDDRPSRPAGTATAASAMDAIVTGPRGPANHHDPPNGHRAMKTPAVSSSSAKSSDASVAPDSRHGNHTNDNEGDANIEAVLHVTDTTTLNDDDDAAADLAADLATTTTITGATTTTDCGNDSSTTPLWWTTRPTPRHARSTSTASVLTIGRRGGVGGTAIALEDHSEDDSTQSRSYSCWARSATVDAPHIVSGGTSPLPGFPLHSSSSSSSSAAGAGPIPIGAYVVWHCTIQTLAGGEVALRKRYSEFDALRADLVRAFPHAAAMIPALPRKSVVSRFRPRFLEQRRVGLDHFLNCVLLNPEFAAAPVVKEFVFS